MGDPKACQVCFLDDFNALARSDGVKRPGRGCTNGRGCLSRVSRMPPRTHFQPWKMSLPSPQNPIHHLFRPRLPRSRRPLLVDQGVTDLLNEWSIPLGRISNLGNMS